MLFLTVLVRGKFLVGCYKNFLEGFWDISVEMGATLTCRDLAGILNGRKPGQEQRFRITISWVLSTVYADVT